MNCHRTTTCVSIPKLDELSGKTRKMKQKTKMDDELIFRFFDILSAQQ